MTARKPQARRQRPAAKKAPASLGSVAEFLAFDPSGRSADREQAKVEARADMELYRITGNGAFFWMAYARIRAAGLTVPKAMLTELDKMVAMLLSAKGTPKQRLNAVAVAVGMAKAGAKGGPQGVAHAEAKLRSRKIVAAVHQRVGMAQPDAEVFRVVALANPSHTARSVGELYRAWMKDAAAKSKRAKGRPN